MTAFWVLLALLLPLSAWTQTHDATVTLRAFPDPVLPGQNTTVTWETLNATSCTASGDWSGSKTASGGNESLAVAGTSDTYTISCNGPSGTAFTDSITVAAMTGTQRHVAKTGSDSNGGTSLGDAWLTIDKANANVSAGMTVWIHAGTYQDQIRPIVSGSSGSRIAYAEWPGDAVTISTQTSSDTYCVNLTDRYPSHP